MGGEEFGSPVQKCPLKAWEPLAEISELPDWTPTATVPEGPDWECIASIAERESGAYGLQNDEGSAGGTESEEGAESEGEQNDPAQVAPQEVRTKDFFVVLRIDRTEYVGIGDNLPAQWVLYADPDHHFDAVQAAGRTVLWFDITISQANVICGMGARHHTLGYDALGTARDSYLRMVAEAIQIPPGGNPDGGAGSYKLKVGGVYLSPAKVSRFDERSVAGHFATMPIRRLLVVAFGYTPQSIEQLGRYTREEMDETFEKLGGKKNSIQPDAGTVRFFFKFQVARPSVVRPQFPVNGSTISADEEFTAACDYLLMWLKEHTQLKVKLTGHTDASGTEQANQTLSEARAAALSAYLTGRAGWEDSMATRVTAVGEGMAAANAELTAAERSSMSSEMKSQRTKHWRCVTLTYF
jgi:outer membrane protein OmpA-like peptidoglycan-associated protein